MRFAFLLLFSTLLDAAVAGQGKPAIGSQLPAGFVYLRDVDATIEQDIRYAGVGNFTARPVPGYEAAECVLLREVALALKSVQADLKG